MEVQKAIEILSEDRQKVFKTDLKMFDDRAEAYDMAIKALKKQIPKNPRDYVAFDGIRRKGCPDCDHNGILYAGQKYCSVCGQAIGWNRLYTVK